MAKKDMFYNYDHNINRKEYVEEPHPMFSDFSTNSKLNCFSGSQILVNLKGEKLGVTAKQNSVFSLFFNLGGINKFDLDYLSSNAKFCFDVIDFEHNVICSSDVVVDILHNRAQVELISSEDGPLSYGVYKMHLYMVLDDKKYTLFSESDGILSID